jgi:hypothetical protein
MNQDQRRVIVIIRLRLLLRRTAVALAEAGRFIVFIVPAAVGP